jgi:hypothetical protein
MTPKDICGIVQYMIYIKDGLSVSLLSKTGVAELGLLESDGLETPSCDSRSKKSDHSSARDSLLVRVSSCESDGVLGVRRNGDMGTRSALLDAPGRAKPACSFCSAVLLDYHETLELGV